VTVSAQESREAELAQLRTRLVELEGKTAKNDQPVKSENIQGFRAEPGAAADRPRE
jgi:hypothetical protein